MDDLLHSVQTYLTQRKRALVIYLFTNAISSSFS